MEANQSLKSRGSKQQADPPKNQKGRQCAAGGDLTQDTVNRAPRAGYLESTPLSKANLEAHNDMHANDPALAHFQALAEVTSKVAAARSLGIHNNMIAKQVQNLGALPKERFMRDDDRIVGLAQVDKNAAAKDDNAK